MSITKQQNNDSEEPENLLEELSDEEMSNCVGGTGLNWKDEPAYYDSATDSYYVYDKKGKIKYLKDDKNISVDPNGSTRTVSDRNLKENCSQVNVQQVLAQVAKLPIQTWNYKQQNPEVRHIGPMAQDFAAAFDVGESDRYIELVDANGVALAAIQALYQMLQEKDAQIEEIKTELSKLQQQVIDSKAAIIAD